MRRTVGFSVLILLGITGLAACGGDSGSVASSGTTQTTAGSTQTTAGSTTTAAGSGGSLAGTSWVLDTYQGPGGNSVPATPKSNATLGFDDQGNVGGSTGCNQFSGTYTVDGDSLTIQLGAMTQMACTNPLVTAQETAVTTLLGKVTGFTVTADSLSLTDDSGELLAYSAGITDLEGTAWVATGVNNGNNAVQSTSLTDKLTATFGGAERVLGLRRLQHAHGHVHHDRHRRTHVLRHRVHAEGLCGRREHARAGVRRRARQGHHVLDLG